MRVSREQAAENRSRVLKVAGHLFREHGLDGVGVADIMGAAGLTHGGFYGQFASKDELAYEACDGLVEGSAEKWERLRAADPDGALAAIVSAYVSPQQCDDPGSGCLLATLPVDVARRKGPIRSLFTAGLSRLVGILASVMAGGSEAARREDAFATMSGLVGAVILARAVDDPELSREITDAAVKRFGAGWPSPHS